MPMPLFQNHCQLNKSIVKCDKKSLTVSVIHAVCPFQLAFEMTNLLIKVLPLNLLVHLSELVQQVCLRLDDTKSFCVGFDL